MDLLQLTPEGLYCSLGDFYIDPWKPVAKAVITHGHGDHAHWGMGEYISAYESRYILEKRLPNVKLSTHNYGEVFRLGDVDVSFHPAGHILGSSQVRIQYQDLVWVFTGDFKRDHDPTCPPFEVVRCDTFISEATFSLPVYRWPDFKSEIKELHDWWLKNKAEGVNSVLCCYALGKAQRVIAGLREISDDQIWVHGTIAEINACYAKAGITWKNVDKVPLERKEKFHGDLILCPPSALGASWEKRLTPKRVALQKKVKDFQFSGHLHPMMRLRYGFDVLRLPSFILGQKSCYMPAFSHLTGGQDIKLSKKERAIVLMNDGLEIFER